MPDHVIADKARQVLMLTTTSCYWGATERRPAEPASLRSCAVQAPQLGHREPFRQLSRGVVSRTGGIPHQWATSMTIRQPAWDEPSSKTRNASLARTPSPIDVTRSNDPAPLTWRNVLKPDTFTRLTALA